MSMISRLLDNMDEEQANEMISQLDEEIISDAVQTGTEEHLIPHLSDIREAATEDYEDPEAVREHYESLNDEEQTERFHQAAADLIAVMTELREDPTEGGKKLKDRLRDPWMIEALLLIFDHEDVPDDVATEQKDFAATWIKWVGVNVLPEMYDQNDVESVVSTLYPEESVDTIIEEMDLDTGDE
jgi:hypothetical protein